MVRGILVIKVLERESHALEASNFFSSKVLCNKRKKKLQQRHPLQMQKHLVSAPCAT